MRRMSLAVPVMMAACVGKAAPPVRVPPAAPAAFAILGTAELVARGIVSSEYTEIRLAVSPDGRTRLWGSTDRPGGPGGWNIWMSRQTGDAWSAPAPAPFDSDANDFDPAFAADGSAVYFFSNRPGGQGGDDIYRVAVTGDGFGEVEHLGPEVNTPGDEWAPSPAPDGTALLFASNAPHAKHDLYLAPVRGAGFAPAAPLPGAINTPDADEFDATFLADGATIVLSRSPDVETDPIQLYLARRGPDGYGAAELLPASVNVADGYTLGPTIDLHDRHVLYVSSKRPEANVGKLDIYRVRYAL